MPQSIKGRKNQTFENWAVVLIEATILTLASKGKKQSTSNH